MARWEVEDFGKSILDKLDNDTNRKIRREMVRNGAKVLQKEMQLATEARHHVVNHWMKDSIAAGEVHEDIDGVSIEVYPQGEDPRGVSNEMKMQIINHGYYHVLTGEKRGPERQIPEKVRSENRVRYAGHAREVHGTIKQVGG